MIILSRHIAPQLGLSTIVQFARQRTALILNYTSQSVNFEMLSQTQIRWYEVKITDIAHVHVVNIAVLCYSIIVVPSPGVRGALMMTNTQQKYLQRHDVGEPHMSVFPFCSRVPIFLLKLNSFIGMANIRYSSSDFVLVDVTQELTSRHLPNFLQPNLEELKCSRS